MAPKTSQLQIRVTVDEKEALKRLAAAAGLSVSSYVLSRVLPLAELEFTRLYARAAEPGVDRMPLLDELDQALERLTGVDLATKVPRPDGRTLSPVLHNCIAAMVERVAARKRAAPPRWVSDVPPLARPHFGWSLQSLRPHQIRVTPVAFKRRNLFFDPAAGPSPWT